MRHGRMVVIGACLATALVGCGNAPPHAYPPDAVTRFTSMCEGDGNGQALCGCYIKSMQQHYPYSQVQNILTINNGDAPEWDAVTRDCASTAAR